MTDSSGRIMLVEDDESLREVLTFNLGEAGYEVRDFARAEPALEAYDPDEIDVVITDIRMPEVDGLELLERLRSADPNAVAVVITAYGSKDRALEAMRQGAFHYVEKPVNKRTLIEIVGKAVEHRRLERQNRQLRADEASDDSHLPIVAASPEMNEVLRRVDKVADADATVLITGESGTGKELVARAIHRRSSRSDAPFVTVNCAAIPEELLESVLFGHEEGAFTGAGEASEGKFAAADGGTLFLDEIAEMRPDLQAKLLRVLQEGEIDVVGAERPTSVDVRVVAATHRDLEARVEAGTFREDLYYRLRVVPIEIPPLRERLEDVPVLFRYFLRSNPEGRELSVAPEVDELLFDYDWPGNVRELKNLVDRVSLFVEDERIHSGDLPDEIQQSAAGSGSAGDDGALPFELPDDGLDLAALERNVIRAALEKMEGNKSATARYLGMPRHKLLYRLDKYDIETDGDGGDT